MLKKLLLYSNTIRKMKLSQIVARIRKMIGLKNTLGIQTAKWNGQFSFFQPVEDLDFDPAFLVRFDVDEFVEGKVTFLHESEAIDWNGKWKVPARSALWNFNLHYFEYLMPFVKAYKTTQDTKYMEAIKTCISGWIDQNPVQSGGDGWAPYTISLRLVYWFSCLFYLSDKFDKELKGRIMASIHEQYVYLANHLEKDLLANHYFENLKALVLCSIVFHDNRMLEKSLEEFKKQCKEQILADGMHYELSPMYHNIILEDILRVAIAVRSVNKTDSEIEKIIQPMIDVTYSFQEGLNRIPLFNDGGNNVAKSMEALIHTAQRQFGIIPQYKNHFPNSGYYILKTHDWKLIVDAGIPGPKINAGHAHCDAMSYELFFQGNPTAVNCGTYAYQNTDRNDFRSTKSHNTVMIDGFEQSQCWGGFRLGKESKVKVLDFTNESISVQMTDQAGNITTRVISVQPESISIIDSSPGHTLSSYVHYDDNRCFIDQVKGNICSLTMPYAKDYGKKEPIYTTIIDGKDEIRYSITKTEELVCYKNEKSKKEESIPKGYKPLTRISGNEYFYKNGKIWFEHGGRMESFITIKPTNWKDNNRITTRLFRREARLSVAISSTEMLLAIDHKIYYVDCLLREWKIIDCSRDKFSDPLNICPCNEKSRWYAIWGEYGSNKEHDCVFIRGFNKNMKTENIYCFLPGQIKHVHNIIPCFNGGYYVLTGDHEETAGIYKTDESFSDVIPIAVGQQKYRAVVAFDTPDGLLYATDAVNDENYVYLLSESGDSEKKIISLNGSCVYGRRIPQGYLFSTVVEPDDSIKGIRSWLTMKRGKGILSNQVELVFLNNRLKSKKLLKMEKDIYPMKLMQFGSIQFDQGNSERVWVYPVGVKYKDAKPMKLDSDKLLI